MTPLAIALVTSAGFIHVLWNLIGKRQNPAGGFFLVASLASAVLLLPALVAFRHSVPLLWAQAAPAMIMTGAFQAVYYMALAAAYRHGHMSLAYPLIRALPAPLITFCSAAFAIGKPLTTLGAVGIAAVFVGCLIVPLPNWRRMHWRDYRHFWFLMTIVGAVGITGYTIIDSETLKRLRALPDSGLGTLETTLVYLVLTTLTTIFWLSLGLVFVSSERARLRQAFGSGLKPAVLAGLLIPVGYCMVLLAMIQASNVSYVAAFRQFSIPLGAAVGVIVQREPVYAAKLVGVGLVLSGLVLIAIA